MWILGLKGLTCCKHNKKDIHCRLLWVTMFKRNNLLSHKELRWKPTWGEGSRRTADELVSRMQLLQPQRQHVETHRRNNYLFPSSWQKRKPLPNKCLFSPLPFNYPVLLRITRELYTLVLDQKYFK